MKIYNGDLLSSEDLRRLGVGAVGQNVVVHQSCVLVGLEQMRFGDNVRIDAFVSITAAGGWLDVGDHVHIGAHSYIGAGGGVSMGSFSGLSAGVRIFSRSDDYTGAYLTNPTVPAQYTQPRPGGPVRLGRHVIVGSGSVILPEVEIGEGAAIGAGTFVTRSLEPWKIFAGAPARAVRPRSQALLDLETELLSGRGTNRSAQVD